MTNKFLKIMCKPMANFGLEVYNLQSFCSNPTKNKIPSNPRMVQKDSAALGTSSLRKTVPLNGRTFQGEEAARQEALLLDLRAPRRNL